MTKDDIIRMAREAGLQPYYDEQEPAIERFAALVASSEREACARLCSEAAVKLQARLNLINMHTADVLQDKAAAIRARGEKV